MQSLISTTSKLAFKSQSTYTAMRFFAGTTKKDAKSLGDEKNYINKQEQQLLKNLLKKVKDQADKTNMNDAELAEASEKEVRALCTKFKVIASDALVKDLLAWKAEAQ